MATGAAPEALVEDVQLITPPHLRGLPRISRERCQYRRDRGPMPQAGRSGQIFMAIGVGAPPRGRPREDRGGTRPDPPRPARRSPTARLHTIRDLVGRDLELALSGRPTDRPEILGSFTPPASGLEGFCGDET